MLFPRGFRLQRLAALTEQIEDGDEEQAWLSPSLLGAVQWPRALRNTLMNLPDFLTQWPFGEIVLTGHRIGLYHVIIYHRDGYTSEMLHEMFPTLPLDLIEKVLTFARENQAEVAAYVDRCQAEIDHLRATTPRRLDWEKMREQFEAMKRAEKK